MKLPISWLRDWVEVDATPEQIADALTRRGFYVEGLEVHGRSFPGVVVAKVLDVSRHPNADRLTVCRVTDGSTELQVVCGAPNVKPGMVVPLATVGAKLPGGMVIQKSTIRGQESQGMLCSARELELSDDHEGIVDLDRYFAARAPGQDGRGLAIGRRLEELFGSADTVLEVEVPFNRPDGLGVVGLAREVKAALDGHWSTTGRSRLDRRWTGRSDFDLELEDPEGCPRYLAQVMGGVVVGPSPAWLVQRLESVGQRSINHVVDLTNFILFEFGQPIHAFDLDRIQGPAIKVRRARSGETLVTLDGVERGLDPEILVIADRTRPIAIAGVMGGADTEVVALNEAPGPAPVGAEAHGQARAHGVAPAAPRSESGGREAHPPTTRILLECAWFQPARVRRAGRALGLATEASRRFERGVDPEIGPIATARFISLLREYSSDVQLGPAREKIATTRPNAPLTLRLSRLDRMVGAVVPPEEAARHLEALEFTVRRGDPLRITIPPWRPDVTLEEDLIEEVARARGYEKIPEAPLETHGAYATRTPGERARSRARDAMLARGLHEAWCTSLVSETEAEAAARLLGQDPAKLVRLRNSMSRESEVLRPNPLPGLIRACALNLRAGESGVRLFEIGTGFLSGGGEQPEETTMLGAIVTGPRLRHTHDAAPQQVDFDEAKGLWEAWLEEMRVDTPRWGAYSAEGWKPGASAEVVSGTSRIGWAGTLGPALLRQWDIEVPVHAFVALLDPVSAPSVGTAGAELPGRFPPMRRDLAFFLPRDVSHGQVERALIQAGGERLASVELFDVYTGPGTPEGMRSLAFALQFQHPERTLTESEVQAIQDRMVETVARECGGRLRER